MVPRNRQQRRPHGLMALPLAMGILLCAAVAPGKDNKGNKQTMVFIQAGKAQAIQTIDKAWTQGPGYLESDPAPPTRNPQTLFGNCSIGSGNFHIKARLTLLNVKRSAACFCFGLKDYFGFEGGHGSMYITGPLFNNAWGDKIGIPAECFTEGKAFDFQCIRKEDILHVMIDDKTVYTQQVSIRALGPCGFMPCRSTMRIHSFSATGDLQPYKKPQKKVSVSEVNNITVHPFVKLDPKLHETNHVRLGNGDILAALGTQACVSSDEGKTWEKHPLFPGKKNLTFRGLDSAALVCTRDNVAILFFVNQGEAKFSWDRAKNLPKPDCRRPTYMTRSLDNGKTWTAPFLIDDSYCGCLNDSIQTKNGTVIVAGQELLYKEGRHTTRPYVSKDNGATWIKADKVDIDMPRGDHSGLIEATLEQLTDGRIWMLLRSYHGFFYESFSSDDGLTWTKPKPSKVKSTGSPGLLKRLADGRLFLMWNAIPNKGFKRREELSIAFSSDDGKTWTAPIVIARNPGGRLSYPDVFERVPGELWFSVGQGHLKGVLKLSDFEAENVREMF